jgi:NAD(P)-dependent dehydrogenase (short-subunit alcohol dehydrogenase family)
MATTTATQIALISGANQGIGLAVANILAREHGYHVVVASRKAAAGEKVAAELRAAGHAASSVQLDLTDKSSIKAAVKTFGLEFGHLDVLINNAGVLLDATWDRTTGDPFDLFEATFMPNVVGTAALTEGLMPHLQKSSLPRIVFVSSIMGSLEKSRDKSTPWYNIDYTAYDASKAAVNVLTLNYARILEGSGAKVNSVCPGLVKTALTRYIEYGTSPDVGATRIVEMATLGQDGPTGTFSNRDGPLPW